MTGHSCKKSPVATSTGSLFLVQVPLQLPSLLLDGVASSFGCSFLGFTSGVSFGWAFILPPEEGLAFFTTTFAPCLRAPTIPVNQPAPSAINAPPCSALSVMSNRMASTLLNSTALSTAWFNLPAAARAVSPIVSAPTYFNTVPDADIIVAGIPATPRKTNSPTSGTMFHTPFVAPIAALPGLSQAAFSFSPASSPHFVTSFLVSSHQSPALSKNPFSCSVSGITAALASCGGFAPWGACPTILPSVLPVPVGLSSRGLSGRGSFGSGGVCFHSSNGNSPLLNLSTASCTTRLNSSGVHDAFGPPTSLAGKILSEYLRAFSALSCV
ncbi:hypothetical protein Xsze_02040 [Xenorhabdus szentirmaii DSM 16338]|nr:hypothetical protein Xsze_02040 [Xenorhabdus szentirmaii DSM 16338]